MNIQTKFNISDDLWFIYDNSVKKMNVHSINIIVTPTKDIIFYIFNDNRDSYLCQVNEDSCFGTKQELLDNL